MYKQGLNHASCQVSKDFEQRPLERVLKASLPKMKERAGTPIVRRLMRGTPDRIFYILAPFLEKKSRLDPKNFNSNFGPFARRHRLWRRGNTARRHSLGRRGTCYAGTPERRGADVAPSSAPQILAPSSVVFK
jgi:hypothetical protein